MVRFALGVMAGGVLAWLAARADASAGATGWQTALDVGVGLTFVAASAVPVGHARQRVLVAAIGVAWLSGSLVPQTRSVHQGLLIIALLAFPAGRIRSRPAWVVVVLSAVVMLGVVPQLGVALLLFLTGLVSLARGNARWYPALAAWSVAAALVVSWSVPSLPTLLDPAFTLSAYETVLILVAASLPAAAAFVVQARRRLADEVLSAGPLTGLDGLAAVLAETLDDPGLRLYRWLDAATGYVDADGIAVTPGRQQLHVDDADGPVALIEHSAPALHDPPTARAVRAAVRLAVVNLRLRELQLTQLRELEAARARVVAAADDQRASVATDLRQEVTVLLRDARAELSAARRQGLPPDATSALELVDESLATAIEEIGDLVAGIPPAQLGSGLLESALQGVARRSPLTVSVEYDPAAAADPAIEAALYYVCSEALANVVKHAGVDHARITVMRQDRVVEAVIADDGRGGADPEGSGLTGLKDRLAAYDGRLRVVSPPGAGTTLTATIPLSRSSATAR
jgi:signal transduction histidine kinase